jgi:uncharacterized protein (TIGR03435 family)
MRNRVRVYMRGAAAALLLIVPALWPQVAGQKAAFVAAAIKLDPKADGEDMEKHPGLLRSQMTLTHYIAYAYDLKPFQVTGGPKWIDEEHYAIEAKLERPADGDAQPQSARMREAMQSLLAERFRVKFHRETKDGSGFALNVDKGGFKLTPVPDDGGSGMNSKGNARRNLSATRADMARLAAFLSRELEGPVVDQTHIQGVYTFTLDWARDDLKAVPNSEASALPSIYTALQEKLGLKLDTRKVPMEIIVVESAERPSEN